MSTKGRHQRNTISPPSVYTLRTVCEIATKPFIFMQTLDYFNCSKLWKKCIVSMVSFDSGSWVFSIQSFTPTRLNNLDLRRPHCHRKDRPVFWISVRDRWDNWSLDHRYCWIPASWDFRPDCLPLRNQTPGVIVGRVVRIIVGAFQSIVDEITDFWVIPGQSVSSLSHGSCFINKQVQLDKNVFSNVLLFYLVKFLEGDAVATR